MDGIQKTLYEDLADILVKVSDGFYGKDNDFDIILFENDLDDLTDR